MRDETLPCLLARTTFVTNLTKLQRLVSSAETGVTSKVDNKCQCISAVADWLWFTTDLPKGES